MRNATTQTFFFQVHYPPYFFECFLLADVFDQKSAAQVGNGSIVFKLEKQTPGLWEQLQNPLAGQINTLFNCNSPLYENACSFSGDKKEQILLRESAQTRMRERSEEEAKKKAEMKRELDRFGVKQQMKVMINDLQLDSDLCILVGRF
jgi:dyslexia susceptibility 1 candidate gene 1 protein